MAQFTSRPETPQEWGGLPSEPLRRDEPTDLAPVTPGADLFGQPLGSLEIGIAVPLIDADTSTGPADASELDATD